MSAPRRSRGSNRPAARLVPLFLAGALLTGPISGGRAAEPMTAQDTLRELRGFRELGSVLHVAAHPDDENTQLIAYLARGRGYRTAYLSLTRGDGGQNVIGPEFFEELGVIRTQELLAARRLDGGRQFFTRAIDFGFSKNPAETLRIWDRKAVVSDIVRVIRTFRPDVIITRFSPQGGGHGHHTASAILAVEAFRLAGDPEAFPEQIGELAAWQPKRILQNSGGFGRGGGGGGGGLRVEIGGDDPVTGEPLGTIAGRSRSMHKSQGFGNFGGRGGSGPRTDSFTLLGGEPATKDIMDGVDTTWARFPGGAEVAKLADEAVAKFDAKDPAASVPGLAGDPRAARLAPRRPPRGREAPPARPGDPGLSRARGRDDRPPGRSRAGRGAAPAALGDGRGRRPRPLVVRLLPAHGSVGRPADRPDGRPARHPRRGADAAGRRPARPTVLAARGALRRPLQGRSRHADRATREPAGLPGRAPIPGRRPDPGDRRRTRAGRRAGPAGPAARRDRAGGPAAPLRRAALRPGGRASGRRRGHGRARRRGGHARPPGAGRVDGHPRVAAVPARVGRRPCAVVVHRQGPVRIGHGHHHGRGPRGRPDLEHRSGRHPARAYPRAVAPAPRAAQGRGPRPRDQGPSRRLHPRRRRPAWPRASRRWATRSPGSPART